ncbi:MAG: sulfotransferase [Pseudomonadota bacterium]
MATFDFLIVGAGRGGTSLLAALLDQHSQVEVGVSLEYSPADNFEHAARDCLMGRKFKHTNDRSLLQERSEAFLFECKKAASVSPKARWGNKITTEQLADLEQHNILNPQQPVDITNYFFKQALDGVQILFILRDGRTCVRSKMQRAGLSLETACERWLYSVALMRFLQEQHGNHLILKYEDLVLEPETTLSEVCTFLGVEYEATMLTGTNNPKMPSYYRLSSSAPSKLNLDNIPDGCLELLRDELVTCAYPV